MDSGEFLIPNDILVSSGDVITDSGSVITTPGPAPVIIQEVAEDPRPFLETSFEDYSVVEGLLLLIFISIWLYAVFSLLKNGFKWWRR